jgi:hypothetical protein
MNAQRFGIKENFFDSRILEEFGNCGSSWEDIEKCLREKFSEEISFLKPNLFTYFLIFGLIFLLSTLFLMKAVLIKGTSAYFFVKLFFIISAMFALKGFVGHFVVVFLNRDRFESELKALKSRFEVN